MRFLVFLRAYSWRFWIVLFLVLLLAETQLFTGIALLNQQQAAIIQFVKEHEPAPTQLGLASPGGKQILGIQSEGELSYFPGIWWQRLSYTTCGNSNLAGGILDHLVGSYHAHHVRVLLLLCQETPFKLLSPGYIQDVAASHPDAVQCGNEEMKDDPPFTRWVPPAHYAHFFALCKQIIQKENPTIPVLMGSLDPRIVGTDTTSLYDQVRYLGNVQLEWNTVIDPGGDWSWKHEAIALNDSWHNGYPSTGTNNLYQLFVFWASQFGVPLDQVHAHLWVSEGTACFTGCGLVGKQQIAIGHIMTLITDVLTATKYHVPFFYFSGHDFASIGRVYLSSANQDTPDYLESVVVFPNGVYDQYWNPKYLRQDLSSPRILPMTCGKRQGGAIYQETLLADLYSGCALPADYTQELEN